MWPQRIMDRYSAKDAGLPVTQSLRQGRLDTYAIHQYTEKLAESA